MCGKAIRLDRIAKVIRSKNAGPFMTTFDVFFDNFETYKKTKESGIFTKELIAALYKIPKETVVGIYCDDNAMGIKITIEKPDGIASGDVGCTDIYGTQQHAPLMSLEIPV
jgi:Domain of unknown function (DUF4387)